MNSPLISVGILSYERPELLKYTLDSVRSQTYTKIEILISDNCSSNAAVRKVIGEFLEKKPTSKVFFQEKNRGAFWNFKFLLNQATSPLFIWLADDDFWSPDYLQSLLTARGVHAPTLAYSRAAPFNHATCTQSEFAKERPSGKKGICNVIRQITFDSDSIFYGLFDTEVGRKYINLLKSWAVPKYWKRRFPTIEVDFVSYAFLYGMLLNMNFTNASISGSIHYINQLPYNPRKKSEFLVRTWDITQVVAAMVYIHVMLAGRFLQAAMVSRSISGFLFAPFAAAYLFIRRIIKATFAT